MADKINITVAQINPIVGDLPFNSRKISEIYQDAGQTSDLIIYPELALCGYPPEDLILKPAFIKSCASYIEELAQLTADLPAIMAVGAPLQEKNTIYNALYILAGGKITAIIKKHHLPNYGVFDEKRVFSSAPLKDNKPVTVKNTPIGFIICEDGWHDDVALHLKDQGAEILVMINASPYTYAKQERRHRVVKKRVEDTGLPLLYVNQTGGQDEIVFDGGSFASSAGGKIIFRAESFIEDTQSLVWERHDKHANWLSNTAHITAPPERLEGIYTALIMGLRDYITKNGFSGVLLGLSGGIDSALAAAIAVDALGKEAVHGVSMPSQYTSTESLEDAEALAKNLGIHLDTVPIKDPVESFEATLSPYFPTSTPGITHENIQSRCRGLILMALSNTTGKMVLSTGNKSEIAVGYATLYGDMCGGFNALKDVYKTEVYALARWRNAHKTAHSLGPDGLVIPERSITKAPTAELKPDQTDQDTLPPYDVLDDILFCLIEEEMELEKIAERGHDPSLTHKIWTMLDRAEYKRRQAPPGTKITPRAFGRDRRYPITNHFHPEKL